MSYAPFFFDYNARPRLVDQHFGLTPQDYLTIIALPKNYRSWRKQSSDTGSTIREDKDKFQINLDIQHFAPEEISVKTVDGFLVVEAKHEERQDDHGFISRSFTRRYPLPEDVDPDTVTSKLSSDGVLSVTAPLKPAKGVNERVVPIIQTGPVRQERNDAK